MAFIKATVEHSSNDHVHEGEEMEVVSNNVSAFHREDDGSVILLLNDGSVFRTSINVQKLREIISNG